MNEGSFLGNTTVTVFKQCATNLEIITRIVMDKKEEKKVFFQNQVP